MFVLRLQMGVLPEHVPSSVHWTQAPVAEHAGRVASVAAHSAAPAHATQACFDDEQIGVFPEQLPLPRHCTHRLAFVSHKGVSPEQVELSMHSTHWPWLAQAGRPGLASLHSAPLLQPAQECVLVLQMGEALEQVPLVRHSTHVPVAVLHTGVLPEQVDASVHWTHAPVLEQAWWVGSTAAHSAAAAHPAQTWAVVEQTGVAPEQLLLDKHWTHLPLLDSQTGVAPEHAVSSTH